MTDGNEKRAHILALEPWLGGSHRAFLEQWQEHSRHEIEIMGLPARHWRWRMRTSAWQFARDLAGRTPPDALWVSDYVDLPTLLGLLPSSWSQVPITAYFHENQATYPSSKSATKADAERDHHLAWTNLLTALRANRVVFNSEFHRREFERGMDELLRIWPKPNPRLELEAMLQEAEVISPGVRMSEIDLGGGCTVPGTQPPLGKVNQAPSGPWFTLPSGGCVPGTVQPPLRVLFNQRWEHDKDPAAMLAALIEARAQGARFELLLLGERYRDLPTGASERLAALADVTLESGFVESRESYFQALGTCDLVVSTARHEFFGIAVVEALAAGCTPLLPNRLAYPEVIPVERHGEALYQNNTEFVERIVKHAAEPEALRNEATRIQWRGVAALHDAANTAVALDAIAYVAGCTVPGTHPPLEKKGQAP